MELVWDPAKFATGVELIDEQHRELFGAANDLLEAARQGRSQQQIGLILDKMRGAALAHFSCEENIMERHNCSTCVTNKLAHKWFLRDFETLRESFARDGVTPAWISEFEEKVCTWFTEHLLAIDLSLRETTNS